MTTPAGATPSCTGTTTVTCTFSFTGTADSFTVPSGVTQATIAAEGAQGGAGNGVSGGGGAQVQATFPVTPGGALSVIVGGAGTSPINLGGGGGGSFVYTSATSTGLLIAAAGGGGAASGTAGIAGRAMTTASAGQSGTGGIGGTAGTGGGGGGGGVSSGSCPPTCVPSGGGGGGLLTNGGFEGGASGCDAITGGQALANGSAGGSGTGGGGDGGFGGGGGACGAAGGGGGGYNGGGGGGGALAAGGGGGAFFATSATSRSGIDGANSGNGQVTITYTPSPTSSPTPVASSQQFGIANQTDVFSVAPNGEVDVRWVVGAGKWNGPLAISSPGLAQPGSFLAASAQFGAPNQTDVVVVDKNGTTDVLWVQGAGKWNGPLHISSTGLATPGAHLAASNQFGIANQTDVFVVDTTGTAQVLWVQGAGKWNGPLPISGALAPSGAGLATSNQFGIPNQTDVFVVDKTGTVDALWVQGAGKWNGPLGISPAGLAPAGAGLSSSRQFGVPNQTDVFVSDTGGTVEVVWVQGAGKWNGPLGISPTGLAQPGGELSSSEHFGIPVSGAPIQTDVFVADHTGTLQVLWVENAGKWNGPLQIGPTGLAVAGAALASSNQFGIPNQTDVWLANTSGALQVFWVQNTGAWNGPLGI